MNIKQYLKDNINFIVFFTVLMSFIMLVSYFDRKNRLLDSDILYMLIVSLIMFSAYILIDFYLKYQHIKKLILVKDSADKTPILPEPADCKDQIYASIIDGLYRSYTESIKNIQEEFAENKDFITTWAHEIKTPITTSKLLIESFDTASADNTIKSVREEIDRIDNYVEKVLYYSRTDNFSKDYILSEITINRIVKESIKKHSVIFIRKHIKLNDNLTDAFTVDTDGKWLLFIIDQLISNALKYTHEGGSISIDCSEDDKEKSLIIEDTGTGIKAQDLNRLFEKSFTGYNGRNENTKSTGFGLYLSQKLARKLGHYITIQSEYGKGTKAIIHFPKWNDYYNVTKM